MASNEEKRETAMVLASNRRLSRAGFSDTRPCRVCELPSEVKDVVEGLLGAGLAFKPILNMVNKIIEIVSPEESAISNRTLELHRKNHIPIRLFMQREVVERRAKAASIDIEGEDGSVMTPAAYAEIMMNSATENLINNPDSVSPMEGLAAAKTLHEMDSKDRSDLDVARMADQLNQIILAVKAVCSPSQLETIVTMINSDKKTDDDIDVL